MPKITNKQHHLVIYLLLVACYLLFTNQVYADELIGNGYIIKMSTINITSGPATNPSFKINTSLGQTSPGEFDSTGYRVKSGFQYSRTNEPFSFAVDSDSINLGSIIANNFASAKTTLTVNSAGIHGYTIKAIENHPLQIGDSPSLIPDTACDPKEKCTPNQAGPWTSTTSYGFGYNLSTDDPTYFRPFASNQLNQNPVTIMSNPKPTKKDTMTLTLQANISPIQGNGLYENSIQFIAIPSY